MLRFVPAILWMGVIFALSSQTDRGLKSLFPLLDSFDWGHYVAYFILAALLYFGFTRRSWRTKGWVIAIAVLYGVTDEFHQSFVPGRTPDGIDLLNDGIGASLAMLVAAWREKK